MALAETRSRAGAARGLKAATGLGVLCLLANGFFLAANDTLAKLAMTDVAVGQWIVMRGGLVVLLILGYLVATRQLGLLRVENWRGMAVYSLCMVGSTHLFLQALLRMPLGDTTALSFSAPLFTTALAALLLKERVGWRRWLAVACGFVGVLIMLAPSGQGYSFTVALMPLTVALLVSVRDVVSRGLSVRTASIAILFHNMLWTTLSGFVLIPFEPAWQLPDGTATLSVLASALFLGIAQYLIVEAYRFGELSALMPFRYCGIVFAAGFGFLVWGDVPTWGMVAGAGLIVGSGLFIWYREQRRRAR